MRCEKGFAPPEGREGKGKERGKAGGELEDEDEAAVEAVGHDRGRGGGRMRPGRFPAAGGGGSGKSGGNRFLSGEAEN